MTERQRLDRWMDKHNIGNTDLARRLDFDRSYIYLLRTGGRDITDAFRWRFRSAYGNELADEIFGRPQPNTHPA